MTTIVVDAMGGDFYPDPNIEGAVLATNDFPISVILVGNESLINEKLKKYPKHKIKNISVLDAPEVVEMAESPSKAFRKKKNSSINIGLEYVKKNKNSGFISAGNTGAVLAASTFILGRIEGIERPALSSIIPSEKGHFIMLDIGSNVDCKPIHLLQFAVMGACFSEKILHIKFPKVGLLNIGEEKDKGNQLTNQTYDLLETSQLNFIGNIEAKELTQGKSDVVVCDGFIGNNLLKFGESFYKLFGSFFKTEAKSSLKSALALWLLKPALKKLKKKFDYDEYGGAHFLGVNGVSLIAHGSANAIAIKNAIRTAYESIESEMVSKITENIKHMEKKILINDEKKITC